MSTAKSLAIAAMVTLVVRAAPAPGVDKLTTVTSLGIHTSVSNSTGAVPSRSTLEKPAIATGHPSGTPFIGIQSAHDTAARMFHIPDGQENGVYHAYMDDDGNEVHEPIDSLDTPSQKWLDHFTNKASRNSSLVARENIGQNCPENAAVMDQSEVQRAAYNLGSACDGGGSDYVKPRSARYALSGGAIVFTCNHLYENWLSGTNARGCSTSEVTDNIVWVEDKTHCNNMEGWRVFKQLTYPAYYYSYGVTKAGSGFCSYVS